MLVDTDEASHHGDTKGGSSQPWPTVNRISLTFSWRRTRAAVETEEATYQPRVVAIVENNLGEGGRNPQESKHEKGKKSFPRKNARGDAAAAHSYLPPEGGSRRRPVEY